MTQHWFVPRSYGYGCTPVTWQGWLSVAVYTFATLGVAVALPFMVVAEVLAAGLTLGWIVVTTIPFIWFCQRRTDGEWRWRWGSG